MKFNTVKILLYAMAALAFLQLTSCLEEKEGYCPDGSLVSLRFSFTHHTGEGDLFRELVEQVDVYFFDSNDHYVHTISGSQANLVSGNTLNINLEEGIYKIVAWGNLHSGQSDVKTEQTRNGYMLEVTDFGNDAPDLFHGMTEIEVNNKGVSEEIAMIRNTNRIRVLLKGLPQVRSIPETDYAVSITGANSLYNFENKPVAEAAATYIPTYSTLVYGNDHYELAEFKVQRLYIGDDVRVNIYEGERSRIDESLTEKILEYYDDINTNDDLDRYYEYELLYTLQDDGTFLFSGINIVDWENPQFPGDL